VLWKKKKPKPLPPVANEPVPTISSRIENLKLDLLADKEACIEINRFLTELEKTFTGMNADQQEELVSIRSDCQLLTYSSIDAAGKKESLKKRVLMLSIQLEQDHSAYL
jgi:hypothetical protein